MRTIHGVGTLAVLLLAACGRKQEAARVPAADSAGEMGGMRMAMQGVRMLPMMGLHLDSLGAMAPEQMSAMMAAHQDLASRMMDAMGADMRGMGMQADSAWTALGDSLRRDLADLPGLSGQSLKSRMEAHVARMQRMMTMHRGMMKM
jgi:hypothetical protein